MASPEWFSKLPRLFLISLLDICIFSSTLSAFGLLTNKEDVNGKHTMSYLLFPVLYVIIFGINGWLAFTTPLPSFCNRTKFWEALPFGAVSGSAYSPLHHKRNTLTLLLVLLKCHPCGSPGVLSSKAIEQAVCNEVERSCAHVSCVFSCTHAPLLHQIHPQNTRSKTKWRRMSRWWQMGRKPSVGRSESGALCDFTGHTHNASPVS